MEQSALQPGPLELTAHRRSLPALTGLRFFAAYYVVIFHSRISAVLLSHGHWALSNFFSHGYLAVPLFFLLSGFILAYTYEGQIEKAGDHRRFWEARFARIWPVYALSLFLNSLPSLDYPRPPAMLAAILMVQAWNPLRPELAGVWNLVCWTLSVEAVFYICFPWVQTWVERRRTRWQIGLIALMLLLCIAFNLASLGLGRLGSGLLPYIPLPILHLPEFFVGVGMGNLFIRRLTLSTVRPGRSALAGRGALTYIGCILTVGLLCLDLGHWTSLVALGFSALIYGLAAERTFLSRILSTKLAVLGGGISYSVYLMQMPVKTWVLLLAHRFHLESEVLRLLANAAALLLVSWALFRGVEDPARRFIRSLFARLEDRRAQGRERRQAVS